jgi:hypothetical protein
MSGECRVPVDTILELAGLIYDSVADSSRWPAFLESFLHAVGAFSIYTGRSRCRKLANAKAEVFTVVRTARRRR